MAGTDWPISLRQLPYAQSVALYRDHLNFLTPIDKNRVLSETVQKVWPFHQLEGLKSLSSAGCFLPNSALHGKSTRQ